VSYLVLARKYRPQSFDDLIGQEHVAQTLANAIAQDRVAHAFLFTGVRGVGKTTSARILAKCLNCLGADGQQKGPTSKPCQVCAACTEIAAGVDMDVQEIDAASYNGVDEVRRLQEGLAFRPARDRFKIYIVDEVHMLSNAAWNAFLKTLEEPPPHVKFIFATTEVHKVPVTILSRCQRYDFKLVGARQIGAALKDIVGREKLAADEAAVNVLAREAAGSMRDAMSLLDQVIAYGAEKITADVVARVLGVADREVLHKLTSAMLSGDAGAALEVLDQVARQGFDMVHLWKDLMRHIRNLVVAKVCSESQARDLLDVADEEVTDVLALAAKSDRDDLTRIFTGLSRGFDDIVKSGQVRSNLEMTLVRLARRPALLPLDELLSRLGELEKRLATGAPPPERGGGGPSGGGGRGARPESHASITSALPDPSVALSGSPAPITASTTASSAPATAPLGGPLAPPPTAARASASVGAAQPTRPLAESPSTSVAPPAAPSNASPSMGAAQAPTTVAAAAHSAGAGQAPTTVAAAARSAGAGQAPATVAGAAHSAGAGQAPATVAAAVHSAGAGQGGPTVAGAGPGLGQGLVVDGALALVGVPGQEPLRNEPVTSEFEVARPAAKPESDTLMTWRALIDRVRKISPPVAAMLDLAIPMTITKDRLVIGVEEESFEHFRADQTDARNVLTEQARVHFGVNTEVIFEQSAKGAKVASVAFLDAAKKRQAVIEARAAVEKHPLVQHAIRLFQAELKDVKLPAQED
jgi:DNA polymerase-3 subunit gamma/tau